MRILFVHSNFPAQFRDLAPALAADPANEVVFATAEPKGQIEGVRKVYLPALTWKGGQVHRYLREFERAVVNGQAAFRLAQQLRHEGFVPDLIYGFSGWGHTFFLKDAFPEAALVTYHDWFYRPRGSNGDFFPDRPMTADRACLFRVRNIPALLDAASADWGVVTTEWQLSQFPADLWAGLSLLHDGIDTGWFHPHAHGRDRFHHPAAPLPPDAELVTYATRGMEPYRGFDVFLRAVELLIRRRPKLHVVIAGEDRIVYGSPPSGGGTWKTHLLDTLDLPAERVHFTGPLPRADLRSLLRAGHAHVYLSAPFIPSWSLFEAMACGALVVGSDTEPVAELVVDGHNGLLAPFFDHDALARRLGEALDNQEALAPLRAHAAATISDRYALADLLPRQIRMLHQVLARTPAPAIEGSVAGRLPEIAVPGGR